MTLSMRPAQLSETIHILRHEQHERRLLLALSEINTFLLLCFASLAKKKRGIHSVNMRVRRMA